MFDHVCTETKRALGFLRCNLSVCRRLERPVLENGSLVWDPSSILLQGELEKVQKKAAKFVTANYIYETWRINCILGQLKWESLKKIRGDSRLIMLYKGLKDAASKPIDDIAPFLN